MKNTDLQIQIRIENRGRGATKLRSGNIQIWDFLGANRTIRVEYSVHVLYSG